MAGSLGLGWTPDAWLHQWGTTLWPKVASPQGDRHQNHSGHPATTRSGERHPHRMPRPLECVAEVRGRGGPGCRGRFLSWALGVAKGSWVELRGGAAWSRIQAAIPDRPCAIRTLPGSQPAHAGCHVLPAPTLETPPPAARRQYPSRKTWLCDDAIESPCCLKVNSLASLPSLFEAAGAVRSDKYMLSFELPDNAAHPLRGHASTDSD